MTGATSSRPTDALARALYRDTIVRVAARVAPRRLLDAEPLAADTWFAAPARPSLSFDAMREIARSDVLAVLAEIWQADGLDELMPLVGGFTGIRAGLAESPAEDDGAPPELIYTLY